MADPDTQSPETSAAAEPESLNPKKRGLGRGLGALFEDEEAVYPQTGTDSQTPGAVRKNLGLEQIEPSSIQPRQVFDEDSLDQLAESIKEHGLLQPIIVRPSPHNDDHYEIVAGERRWRASQRAQLHEVPVVIRDLEDSAALQIALIENLQREDLNPIEEAHGYERLIEYYGHSADSVGELMGKSRSYIANTLRLLQLPNSVQVMVIQGKLTAGHARALVGSENALALAEEVISKNLSVRQTEKLVADSEGREIKKRSKKGESKPKKDVDTLALESEVSNVLGMKVSIDMKDEHVGSLTVSFSSLDQLDEVLHRLTHFPGSKQGG